MDITYCNPILPYDFPDPHVVYDGNRLHFFATQAKIDGKWVNIQHTSTTDMRSFAPVTDALPDGAPWSTERHQYWAPCVVPWLRSNMWHMYYTALPDPHLVPDGYDPDGMTLAIARAKSLNDPFVDIGRPMFFADKAGISWHNIDPDVRGDTIYFGHGSLRYARLTPSGFHLLPGTSIQKILHANGKPYSTTLEAPIAIRRGAREFMLFSGDDCWQLYGVSVAEKIEGQYVMREDVLGTPDSLILRGSDAFRNPGHPGYFVDSVDQEWLFYHAMRGEDANGPLSPRVLCLDRLLYDEHGWPYVAGGVPSTTEQIGPIL